MRFKRIWRRLLSKTYPTRGWLFNNNAGEAVGYQTAGSASPHGRNEGETSGSVKRVIVVDPSLRDNIGHHIEYDRAVQQACSEAHIDCLVLAHRDVEEYLPHNPIVIPTFSLDMWGNIRAQREFSIQVRLAAFALSRALLVVPVLRYVVKTVRSRLVFFRPQGGQVARTGARLAGRLTRAARKALRLVHRGARSVLPPVLYRLAVVVIKILLLPLSYIRHNIRLPARLLRLFLLTPSLYFEIKRALRKHNVGPGDLIFCHMLVGTNVLEWAAVATELARCRGAKLLLLLRYPAAFYQGRRKFHSRLAFRALEQAFEAGVLRLATDSERLAREFSDVTWVPFEIYPIPHTTAFDPDPNTRATEPGAKIRVVSLGNARAEKGIIEILEAIRLLSMRPHIADVEFVLQVHQPDELCSPAIDEFRCNLPNNVILLNDALDSAEYQALLCSASIVLVPYWRDVYLSRTSGVLLEALAAGKPAIVTDDTWMSDELARWDGSGVRIPSRSPVALADGIIRMIENISVYRERAYRASKECRAYHSPSSLLQHLLGRAMPLPKKSSRAVVIYPWEDLLTNRSGAAVRTGLLIEFLLEKNYTVSALVPVDHGDTDLPSGLDVVAHGDELRTPLGRYFYLFYVSLFRLLTFGRSVSAEWLAYRHRYWLRRRRFKFAFNKAILECDLVFVEYTFVADMVKTIAAVRRVPMIVTSHDVLAAQTSYEPLYRKILDYEVAALKLADRAVCVSLEDQRVFKGAGVDAVVVPNSISFDDIRCVEQDVARRILIEAGTSVPATFILFLGSKHPPNVEAKNYLITLASELDEQNSGIHVVVAGTCADPGECLGNFIVLGSVPSVVKDALYSLASAVVIPLRFGTGSSLKTVEAMAYGRPIVGSSVAFRGYPIQDGEHAIVVDDRADMAEAVRSLVADPRQCARLGAKAREFAEQFDYRRTYRPYGEIIECGEAGPPDGLEQEFSTCVRRTDEKNRTGMFL